MFSGLERAYVLVKEGIVKRVELEHAVVYRHGEIIRIDIMEGF